MELLVDKGAFLSPNMAAITQSVADHKKLTLNTAKKLTMNTFRFLIATVAAVILLVPEVRAQQDAPEATYTLIQNVKIFDGVNDKLTPGNVLIENNLIKQVGDIKTAPEGTTYNNGFMPATAAALAVVPAKEGMCPTKGAASCPARKPGL